MLDQTEKLYKSFTNALKATIRQYVESGHTSQKLLRELPEQIQKVQDEVKTKMKDKANQVKFPFASKPNYLKHYKETIIRHIETLATDHRKWLKNVLPAEKQQTYPSPEHQQEKQKKLLSNLQEVKDSFLMTFEKALQEGSDTALQEQSLSGSPNQQYDKEALHTETLFKKVSQSRMSNSGSLLMLFEEWESGFLNLFRKSTTLIDQILPEVQEQTAATTEEYSSTHIKNVEADFRKRFITLFQRPEFITRIVAAVEQPEDDAKGVAAILEGTFGIKTPNITAVQTATPEQEKANDQTPVSLEDNSAKISDSTAHTPEQEEATQQDRLSHTNASAPGAAYTHETPQSVSHTPEQEEATRQDKEHTHTPDSTADNAAGNPQSIGYAPEQQEKVPLQGIQDRANTADIKAGQAHETQQNSSHVPEHEEAVSQSKPEHKNASKPNKNIHTEVEENTTAHHEVSEQHQDETAKDQLPEFFTSKDNLAETSSTEEKQAAKHHALPTDHQLAEVLKSELKAFTDKLQKLEKEQVATFQKLFEELEMPPDSDSQNTNHIAEKQKSNTRENNSYEAQKRKKIQDFQHQLEQEISGFFSSATALKAIEAATLEEYQNVLLAKTRKLCKELDSQLKKNTKILDETNKAIEKKDRKLERNTSKTKPVISIEIG